MAAVSATSALDSALFSRLPSTPPSRLDAPSLALAIIRRDVDAVATLLEHGVPLQFGEAIWGCTSVMELATHARTMECADNHEFRNEPSLQSHAACVAYRKAKRPADDSERRVKQRRESAMQRSADRLGHAERKRKR